MYALNITSTTIYKATNHPFAISSKYLFKCPSMIITLREWNFGMVFITTWSWVNIYVKREMHARWDSTRFCFSSSFTFQRPLASFTRYAHMCSCITKMLTHRIQHILVSRMRNDIFKRDQHLHRRGHDFRSRFLKKRDKHSVTRFVVNVFLII